MSWNNIIDKVQYFKKNNRNTCFRGQGNSSWELKSSLFRQNLSTLNQFLNNERTRYNLFKNLGHIYHNEDDWTLVYIMQHHGVKTRLLDWTEAFATALFFASSSWDENVPITIWMLNPLELNRKTLGSPQFYTTYNRFYSEKIKNNNGGKGFPDNSIALHPVRNNTRIVAQQGVFTIQGNTLDPLDKEFNGDLIKEGILERIDIDIKYREDVMVFLELSGINPFSIFPDLEGLARYVNKKTDKL
ncbi:FRG domain-containing protein [Paenibacillus tarimensis]